MNLECVLNTAFWLQVPKSCTNLDLLLLYISILRTHTKFRMLHSATAQCRLTIWKCVLPQNSSELCSRILFASTEVMHRPRCNCPLHIDILFLDDNRVLCFRRTEDVVARVCVLAVSREVVLRSAHGDSLLAGHPGIDRTIASVAHSFYWPGLHVDVSHFVRSSASKGSNHQRLGIPQFFELAKMKEKAF